MMKKGPLLLVLLSFLAVMGVPENGFSVVAIGYDYAVAPGDPNFAAVILPTGIGDNLYDLYLFNGTEYYFEAQLAGGFPGYIFDPGGVDRFRILGIEASAGLDPNDPEAFNTWLAWVEDCECTEIEHAIIETVFSDIPIGYWADDFIMAIYDAGITGGCFQNPLMYCPAGNVTREQMAVFITRVLNQVAPDGYCGTTNPFPDVGFDRWSCNYIKRFYELGITGGYGDGRFGPEDSVTREQMAVFLTTALNMIPPDGYCRVTDPFADVGCDRWSCSFVKRFREMEITAGYGDGRFGPVDFVTRDQMAVFLSRALTVQENQRVCSTTGYCGPEGGELKVTDPGSDVYGVRIVIPPGALDSVRSLTIEEAYGVGPSLPPGFIAYPDLRAIFQLATGGDKPYDLGLEFYLPVQGMTIGPGQIACAFAYDERVGKWGIVLPDTIDGSTMTFKTTYRERWMWGKIVVDAVAVEYLVPVVEEKYGVETWRAIVERVNEFYNQPEVQNLQPNCASLITLRDNFLESMKQGFRQRLETFQTQFGDCVTYKSSGVSGTCDVLSEEFFSEALTYLKDKLEIEFIEILMGGGPIDALLSGPGFMDCLLLLRMIKLYEEINSLGCAYECVTAKGGLDFWIDFAAYYASKLSQAMITMAINEEWVPCP
jgi:hypothetical protein